MMKLKILNIRNAYVERIRKDADPLFFVNKLEYCSFLVKNIVET